ncbi:transporter substrate-binding domain-containing protein [Thalassotalea euphylliae]|uniref:transporter substrate-binding domain-containing protein n=1 Tax=Thalassotalea euphylliae TaxID=1655234 RepID=UPI0036314803
MCRFLTTLVMCIAVNICFTHALAKDLPTLNVVTEDWPPYNYLDGEGKVVGTATARVKRILQLANVNYSINLLPWARAYNAAISQPNTLIYSIYRTKERETLFHWFCPLSPKSDFFAYALSERTISIKSDEELTHFSVAVSRNEVEHIYLNNIGFKEGKNLYISAEDESSLDHVLNRKVDLFIESQESIETRLKKRSLPNHIVVPVYKLNLEQAQHCFAFSKGTSPEVLKRTQDAFNQLNNSKN